MSDKRNALSLNRRDAMLGLASAGIASALPLPGRAQDEGLYDPVPPADSVFLRLISAMGGAQVGPAVFADGGEGAISPYKVLEAGTLPLSAGDLSAELTLEPGTSYSLALIPEAPGYILFKDEIVEDPRKCGLMLYNLSATPAKLFVPRDGKEIPIIEGLAPGAHQTRAVNAITVDLAVAADGSEIGRFPQVKLRRRSHMTFVVAGPAGALKAMSAENATG